MEPWCHRVAAQRFCGGMAPGCRGEGLPPARFAVESAISRGNEFGVNGVNWFRGITV